MTQNTFLTLTLLMVFPSLLDCLTIKQLHDKYNEIFARTQNRNAASHLWATYIIKRSASMTRGEILNLFSGFCPVSGSPVIPTERPEFRVPVQKAGSPQETVMGDIYFCCTPCVCDTMEFVRTDQVDLNTTSGVETFNALVIGDPCGHPEKIPKDASELSCGSDGKLVGASLSNKGHVVIGLMQEGQPREAPNQVDGLKEGCEKRKKSGYPGGMGTIFANLTSINPI